MSSPSLPVILAPEAQDDYADVQVYTLQVYGPEQWERYESRIAEVLDLLAEHPYVGTTRDELPAHYRVFPVEQHRIVYYRHYREVIALNRP